MSKTKNILTGIAIVVLIASFITLLILISSTRIWTLSSWRILDVIRLIANVVVAAFFIFITVTILNIRGGKNKKQLTPLTISIMAIITVPLLIMTYGLGVSTVRITQDLLNGTSTYTGTCTVSKVKPTRPRVTSNKFYLTAGDSFYNKTFEITLEQFELLSGKETSVLAPVFAANSMSPDYPCSSEIKIEFTNYSTHILTLEQLK